MEILKVNGRICCKMLIILIKVSDLYISSIIDKQKTFGNIHYAYQNDSLASDGQSFRDFCDTNSSLMRVCHRFTTTEI